MATLEQHRAALAYKHVQEVVDGLKPDAARKYRTQVLHLGALIRSAGLCQALHFLDTRSGNEGEKVLDHLAVQVKRVAVEVTDRKSLLAASRNTPLEQYLHLTREVLACADWYRRAVQSLLPDSEGGRG